MNEGYSNSSSSPATPDSKGVRQQVQIPRIEPRTMSGSHRQRTPHACESCREKKAKCDGVRPVCGPCRDAGRLCEYGEGKREKQRLKMEDLEKRVRSYEKLLNDIKPMLDMPRQAAVQRIMEDPQLLNSLDTTYSGNISSIGSMSGHGSMSTFGSPPTDEDVVMETETLAGPPAEVDHLVMDINTLSVNKPSGYMGRVSDETWLSKIIDDLAQKPALQTPSCEPLLRNDDIRENADVTTYYVDDQDTINITAENSVDQNGLPLREVADNLIRIYFMTVQPLFPIIEKKHFLREYDRVYKNFDPRTCTARYGDNSFLCILNLVFALGQTYSDLINDWSEERNTHIEYFFRARVLGALDGGLVYKVGTMQQIQIMGLSGLYCLGTKQANRAWNATGLAIRLAQGLGLHLRNEAPTLNNVQKEMRLRVWYSLHYLETTLCLLTGRPLGIREVDCSSPVPRPIHNEMGERYPDMSENQDPFFLANRWIAEIFAEVSTQLYSPRNVFSKHKDWPTFQNKMRKLEGMLDDWREALPPDLQFLDEHNELRNHVNQRMDLALLYYNVRILIHRPSVCTSDQGFYELSPDVRAFRKKSASDCVSCARQILKIMVAEPDVNKRLSTIPWWCFLHYFTAASAIIMSDVIYTASGQFQLRPTLMEEARSSLRWLVAVSKRNLAGRRCCIILCRILKLIAVEIGQSEQREDLDEEIRRAWDIVDGGDMLGGFNVRNPAAYFTEPLDFLNRFFQAPQPVPTFFATDWSWGTDPGAQP